MPCLKMGSDPMAATTPIWAAWPERSLTPRRLRKSLRSHGGDQQGCRKSLCAVGHRSKLRWRCIRDYWITCEESVSHGHGYAFLTHKDDQGLVKPRRSIAGKTASRSGLRAQSNGHHLHDRGSTRRMFVPFCTHGPQQTLVRVPFRRSSLLAQ